MCGECRRWENQPDFQHFPYTPQYAYQFGQNGLDIMLIELKRAGVTRLNVLKKPINASRLGTINSLVKLVLTEALKAIHGHRLDIDDLYELEDITLEMLNSKKLTELLTANVHPKLFPKWIVMSPNATLLAYTETHDIKALRDQAALISILWRESEQENTQKTTILQTTDPTSSTILKPGELETLTIESETSNIIVRAIQPRLLLVLVGGKPHTDKADLKFFKITPETVGDTRYPPADYIPSPPPRLPSSSSSVGNEPSRNSDQEDARRPARKSFKDPLDHEIRLGLLHIQRKKVDAATEHLRADFRSKGFSMPQDSSIP